MLDPDEKRDPARVPFFVGVLGREYPVPFAAFWSLFGGGRPPIGGDVGQTGCIFDDAARNPDAREATGRAQQFGEESMEAAVRGGVERRRDERYAVHGDAEIVVTGGMSMFRGRIVNISTSGCYVQTVAWIRLPAGTSVELVFVVK